jgi:hypothetical protein
MHVAALIGALVALTIAILAVTMLRHVPRSGGDEDAPEEIDAGEGVPAPSAA